MPFNLENQVSDVPISTFFTWAQFSNRFGLANIIKVSNKDSTQNTGSNVQAIPSGQPNWYAIQDAFNYATDKIQSILQGGVLQIPLNFTPNGGVVPSRVGRWAMIIAFCDLLDMKQPDRPPAVVRGALGKSYAGPSFASKLAEVLDEIAMYRDGIWRQMPEATHAHGSELKAVPWWTIQQVGAAVRYLDGQFTFCPGEMFDFWDLPLY
jgi:hypothetical protein